MGNLLLTEDHKYKLDGVDIPGVTEVLKTSGLSDLSRVPPAILERNSQFGTAGHLAINYLCKGTLDEESLDPVLKIYLEGWKNFVEDYGYVCEKTEHRTFHPVYRYGLTTDQIGKITKGKFIGQAIGDIKFGVPMSSHKYQLAAYKIALDKLANTFILYLNPEFKPRGYKVEFATNDKRAQGVFLCALTIYNVRKEEGLLP